MNGTFKKKKNINLLHGTAERSSLVSFEIIFLKVIN